MTPHFSLQELIASDTAKARGIDNSPGKDILPALNRTAEGLERIRALAGHPIKVLSGYRNPILNQLVGGAKNSQHIKGEAADITCKNMSVNELAQLIADHAIALQVDQVIKEFNKSGGRWVHVSFTERPRHQVLTLTESGYVTGIV